MKKPVFCITDEAKTLFFAKNRLLTWGYPVLQALEPRVTHLLLPVPTPATSLPQDLPEHMTALGGNLKDVPFQAVDFLQDPYYLAENAAITAHCAIDLAKEYAKLHNATVLVIGWGRIGKILSAALLQLGCRVTVAVRKESDCAMLRALGFDGELLANMDAKGYDVVFNTAPAPVLHQVDTKHGALLMDLASCQGILGDDVIWARGLPGKMAPELSGALIAKTALRYALRKE